MKFSHIKPRSIYIVDFDPVRQCEFNGRHLALVLKRNNDKNTFIVMPLTSSPNGENINKINIGNIDTLPPSLRNNITYAVFNQIRTVKADRFIALKDGNKRVNSYVDENTFLNILQYAVNELTFHLDLDKKVNFCKELYNQACVDKAINSAYNIIKLQRELDINHKEITFLYKSIAEDLATVQYSLAQEHVNAGIQDIFMKALGDI